MKAVTNFSFVALFLAISCLSGTGLAPTANANALSCQELGATILAKRKEKELLKVLEAAGAKDVPATPSSLNSAEREVSDFARGQPAKVSTANTAIGPKVAGELGRLDSMVNPVATPVPVRALAGETPPADGARLSRAGNAVEGKPFHTNGVFNGTPGSKVGVYAGTFDPLTSGHLEVIGKSARDLGLKEIWVAVNNSPAHKPGALPHAVREAFLTEAIAKGEAQLNGVTVRLIDMGSPGTEFHGLSYPALVEKLAGKNPAQKITSISGADVVLEPYFAKMKAPNIEYGIVTRPGVNSADMKAQLAAKGFSEKDLGFVQANIDASSTKARTALAKGGDSDLLPVSTRDYIRRYNAENPSKPIYVSNGTLVDSIARDLTSTGRMRAALDQNLPGAMAELDRLILEAGKSGPRMSDPKNVLNGISAQMKASSDVRINSLTEMLAKAKADERPALEAMLKLERSRARSFAEAIDGVADAGEFVNWMKRARSDLAIAERKLTFELDAELRALTPEAYEAYAKLDMEMNGMIIVPSDFHEGNAALRSANAQNGKAVSNFIRENPDADVFKNGDTVNFTLAAGIRSEAEKKFVEAETARFLASQKGRGLSSEQIASQLKSHLDSPGIGQAKKEHGLRQLAKVHRASLETDLKAMGIDSESIIRKMLMEKGWSEARISGALKNTESLDVALKEAGIAKKDLQQTIFSKQSEKLSFQFGNHDLNGKTVNGEIQFFEGELELLTKFIDEGMFDKFGNPMGVQIYMKDGYKGTVKRVMGERRIEVLISHTQTKDSPAMLALHNQMVVREGFRPLSTVDEVPRGEISAPRIVVGSDAHGRIMVRADDGTLVVSTPSVTMDGKGGAGFLVLTKSGGAYFYDIKNVNGKQVAVLATDAADRIKPASQADEVIAAQTARRSDRLRASTQTKSAQGLASSTQREEKVSQRNAKIGQRPTPSNQSNAQWDRDGALAWNVYRKVQEGLGVTNEADLKRINEFTTAFVRELGATTNEAYRISDGISAKEQHLGKGLDSAKDKAFAKVNEERAKNKLGPIQISDKELNAIKQSYVSRCIQDGFCLKETELADVPSPRPGDARLSRAGKADEVAPGGSVTRSVDDIRRTTIENHVFQDPATLEWKFVDIVSDGKGGLKYERKITGTGEQGRKAAEDLAVALANKSDDEAIARNLMNGRAMIEKAKDVATRLKDPIGRIYKSAAQTADTKVYGRIKAFDSLRGKFFKFVENGRLEINPMELADTVGLRFSVGKPAEAARLERQVIGDLRAKGFDVVEFPKDMSDGYRAMHLIGTDPKTGLKFEVQVLSENMHNWDKWARGRAYKPDFERFRTLYGQNADAQIKRMGDYSREVAFYVRQIDDGAKSDPAKWKAMAAKYSVAEEDQFDKAYLGAKAARPDTVAEAADASAIAGRLSRAGAVDAEPYQIARGFTGKPRSLKQIAEALEDRTNPRSFVTKSAADVSVEELLESIRMVESNPKKGAGAAEDAAAQYIQAIERSINKETDEHLLALRRAQQSGPGELKRVSEQVRERAEALVKLADQMVDEKGPNGVKYRPTGGWPASARSIEGQAGVMKFTANQYLSMVDPAQTPAARLSRAGRAEVDYSTDLSRQIAGLNLRDLGKPAIQTELAAKLEARTAAANEFVAALDRAMRRDPESVPVLVKAGNQLFKEMQSEGTLLAEKIGRNLWGTNRTLMDYFSAMRKGGKEDLGNLPSLNYRHNQAYLELESRLGNASDLPAGSPLLGKPVARMSPAERIAFEQTEVERAIRELMDKKLEARGTTIDEAGYYQGTLAGRAKERLKDSMKFLEEAKSTAGPAEAAKAERLLAQGKDALAGKPVPEFTRVAKPASPAQRLASSQESLAWALEDFREAAAIENQFGYLAGGLGPVPSGSLKRLQDSTASLKAERELAAKAGLSTEKADAQLAAAAKALGEKGPVSPAERLASAQKRMDWALEDLVDAKRTHAAGSNQGLPPPSPEIVKRLQDQTAALKVERELAAKAGLSTEKVDAQLVAAAKELGEPGVPSGRLSRAGAVGADVKPLMVVKGVEVYSAGGMAELGRVNPAKAAALTYRATGADELAAVRANFFAGRATIEDLERANARHGRSVTPRVRSMVGRTEAERGMVLAAQEEDYRAMRSAQAWADWEALRKAKAPEAEQKAALATYRAAYDQHLAAKSRLKTARSGLDQELVKAGPEVRKQTRKAAIGAIKQDIFERYADRFDGRTFEQVMSSPVERKRFDSMRRVDAANAVKARKESEEGLLAKYAEIVSKSAPGSAKNAIQARAAKLGKDMEAIDHAVAAKGPQEIKKVLREKGWSDAELAQCGELCAGGVAKGVQPAGGAKLSALAQEQKLRKLMGDSPEAAREARKVLPELGDTVPEKVSALNRRAEDLGKEADELAKAAKANPEAKLLEQEVREAQAAAKAQADELKRSEKLLADAKRVDLAKEEASLGEAEKVMRRFLAERSNDELKAHGLEGMSLKGVAEEEGAAQLAKVQAAVSHMSPEARAGLFQDVKSFAGKEPGAFGTKLQAAQSGTKEAIESLAQQTDTLARVGEGNANTTQAALVAKGLSKEEAALAHVTGVAKNSAEAPAARKAGEAFAKAEATKLENAAAAAEKEVLGKKGGRELAAVDKKAATAQKELEGVTLLKAEQKSELAQAMEIVAQKASKDAPKWEDTLAKVKGYEEMVPEGSGMLESYQMAYVNAAKAYKEGKEWGTAWTEGVKQMLKDSGYAEKELTSKLISQTALCL